MLMSTNLHQLFHFHYHQGQRGFRALTNLHYHHLLRNHPRLFRLLLLVFLLHLDHHQLDHHHLDHHQFDHHHLDHHQGQRGFRALTNLHYHHLLRNHPRLFRLLLLGFLLDHHHLDHHQFDHHHLDHHQLDLHLGHHHLDHHQ